MNGLNELNGLNIFRAVATFLLLVLCRSGLAHEEKSQGTLPTAAIEPQLNAQLPLGLSFRDETGREIRLGDYFTDKPVLLTFVYYECPELCPLVLDGLVRSLRVLTLANDAYQVVAVSVDPDETPALAAAKKQYHLANFPKPQAANGWHFLTGKAPAIAQLAQAAGYRYAPEQASGKGKFIHAAATLALTPGGRISRYLYGFDYAPNDLRFALIDASGNRIGSALDQILLLCHVYDPAQGKYTIAIMALLRFFGIVTVLSLVAFLISMLRRERGRRQPGRISVETH